MVVTTYTAEVKFIYYFLNHNQLLRADKNWLIILLLNRSLLRINGPRGRGIALIYNTIASLLCQPRWIRTLVRGKK
jgi:hypothetical protein